MVATNITAHHAGFGSDPVALVRGNQIYYIHPDHLGRPEKVTNSGKAVVWKANNFGFNRGVALDSMERDCRPCS